MHNLTVFYSFFVENQFKILALSVFLLYILYIVRSDRSIYKCDELSCRNTYVAPANGEQKVKPKKSTFLTGENTVFQAEIFPPETSKRIYSFVDHE